MSEKKSLKTTAGFTPTPHSYWTILASKCSGLPQFHAVGYVMDRTVGVERKQGTPPPKWAKISARVLARLNGYDVRSCEMALTDAVARGMIARKRETCDCTASDRCSCPGRDWLYQALPGAWIDVKPWDRKKLGARDEDATEPDATEPDATEPDATEPDATEPAHQLVLQPGKSGKPVVLSVSIKGMASPVDFKVQPRNDSGLPLSFHTSIQAGNVVRVTVSEGRTNGEPLRNAVRHELPQVVGLSSALSSLLSEFCDKALEPSLEHKVRTALGDAPPDLYERIARRELAHMRQRGKPVMSGILIHLAGTAAHKWRADADSRRHAADAKQREEARIQTERNRPEWFADVRKCIDDYADPSIAMDQWNDEIRRMAAMPEHRDWVLNKFPEVRIGEARTAGAAGR